MNPVAILPDRLDWPSAIGNFLLNFGTLEYLVFAFLEDHLSRDEFNKVKEWHLNDRLDRITQVLKDENYSADELAAFARLRERLDPIRELRNHIAHGYMHLQPDLKARQHKLSLVQAKDLAARSSPNPKHLAFAELQESLGTLTTLVEEFQTLAGFKPDVSSPATSNS